MKLILKIYDYFKAHGRVLWLSLFLVMVILVCLLTRLKFSENISDFMPLEKSEQEALEVYQNISGASRLYILFNNPDDPDMTIDAIDCFVDNVMQRDSLGWCEDLTAQFDMAMIQEVAGFVYENIPYFLTEKDYARMDSLLALPGYIPDQIERDRQMLMFPTGGMMTANLSRDPLGLFTPVLSTLQRSSGQNIFEMYEGYIFTPDMSRAVAMVSSPFGNSETEHNTVLLSILHESIKQMQESYPQVGATVVGGPEIAVGNSDRIKKDSVIAISLSVILILMLAFYAIGSLRNILLIFLSIGWGWLFAMGGMALFGGNVSIIVIGISSVILGIAVNYPLHLIVHSSHVPDMRLTIKEIMAPLVVGNITTVGAFLTLVPLQSTALRDLGIFASLLLVGTILFVLLYLPHMVKTRPAHNPQTKLINRIAAFSPENYKWLIVLVALLTLVLTYFSFKTEFDSDMSNINYMTPSQKENMAYFQSLVSKNASSSISSVYVLSKGENFDQALQKNAQLRPVVDSLMATSDILSCSSVDPFLCSLEEQEHRLGMWKDFVSRHKDELTGTLGRAAVSQGFSRNAFSPFMSLVEDAADFTPKEMSYFAPLTKLILNQNVTSLDNTACIVDVLSVPTDRIDIVESCFDNSFDIASLNSSLSNNLSDNFNYIGWACSLIVFIFLWFSFGSLELALVSFLPMAVSWIWILGIMALLGIKFNIVNIILATFIFGQGDDYTIFMTEGCQHEYTFRKPILASYKSSILQSALIMFIGIGTLIISRHPAMKSLAQVTMTGMFSVVLMSYLIPPLLFKWMTTSKGKVRKHPLTIRTLIMGMPSDPVSLVKGRYIYKGKEITSTVSRNLKTIPSEVAAMNLDDKGEYVCNDGGYGEKAMYIALTHPGLKVKAIIQDPQRREIAAIAANDFIDNIILTNHEEQNY